MSTGATIWNYPGDASGMVFSPVVNEWYVVDHALDRIRAYDTRVWSLLFELPIPEDLQWNPEFGSGTLNVSDDGERLALVTPTGVRLFDLSSRIPDSVPLTPTSFSATNGQTDRITVSWQAVSEASEYQVFRNTTNDFGSATLLDGVVLGTAFLDTGAMPGTGYFYWVVASNVLGNSPPTLAASGIRPIVVPAQVRASDEQYEDRVQLNWSHSQPGATFEIYRSDQDAIGTATLAHETSQLTWADTAPVPGNVYYYWIRAKFGANVGSFSVSDSGLRRIARPTGLVATTSNDGIVLNWDAIDGLGYRIYRSLYDSTSLASEVGYTASGGEFIDATALFGRTYYYFIQGVASDYDSILSDSASALRLLGTPSDFSGTDDRLDEIVISWSALPGATNYRVYRSMNPVRGSASLAISTNQLQYVDENAKPGETWYYWIQAFSPVNGFGVESQAITGTRFGGAMNTVDTPSAPADDPVTVAGDPDELGKTNFFGLLRSVSEVRTINGSIRAILFRDLFTVLLDLDGERFVGRGIAVDAAGIGVWTFEDGNGNQFELTLELRLSDGGSHRLEGILVRNDVPVSSVSAGSSTYHPRFHPAPFAGSYTWLLPHDDSDDPALVPAGEGVAFGTINVRGIYRFRVILADGQTLTMSGSVDDDGQMPCYASPYRGPDPGLLAGMLQVREIPNVSQLDGIFHWKRAAGLSVPPIYEGGFDVRIPVVGALYSPPYRGERMLTQLAEGESNAMWSFDGGALSPAPSNRWMTWDSANRIFDLGNEAQGRVVTQAVSRTGAVNGFYLDQDGNRFSFSGVALPIQGLVAGHFIGDGESGLFTLEPAAMPSLAVFDGEGNPLSPGDTIFFGSIGIEDGIGERIIEVRNTGEGRLLLEGTTLFPDQEPFVLVSGRGGELQPGESSRFRIRYLPQTAQTHQVSMRVFSNDRENNPFEVMLEGSGLAASSASDTESGSPLSPVKVGSGGGIGSVGAVAFDSENDLGNYNGPLTSTDTSLAGWGSARVRSDRRNPDSGLATLVLVWNRLRGVIVGTIGSDGTFSTIRSSGPLMRDHDVDSIQMIESTDGQTAIFGQISSRDGAEVIGEFILSRAAVNGPGDALPGGIEAGAWTIAMPMEEDLGAGYPGGDGIGVLNVRSNGRWSVRLLLADQQRTTAGGSLNEDGSLEFLRTWALGQVGGRWEFRDDLDPSVGNLTGWTSWTRHAKPGGAIYPAGFQLELAVVGNLFESPPRGERVLSQLTDSDGNATAFWTGELEPVIDDQLATWQSNHRMSSAVPVDGEVFSASVSPRDGWVRGLFRRRYVDSVTGKPRNQIVRFNGISLQAQGIVTGSWSESGRDGGFGIRPN
ncbi:MAG: fibronectin type III domain-containing protein [Verrucomicrobiae bacterium]|nr:fibronectin type III domain-containing protein [Verrucomicrobiae bacterium]